MSASVALPPSGRDFFVFKRVVAENASTRTVAGEVGLSQTRVRQLVHRVTQWLSATLPVDPGIDDAAKIRVGQQIASVPLRLRVYRPALPRVRTPHA